MEYDQPAAANQAAAQQDHGDDVVDVSRVLDDLHAVSGADICHVDGTWFAVERV